MSTNLSLNEYQEEITDEVKKIIEEWKDQEGNLIMIFHRIQNYYGYIPRNVAMFVSKQIDIPLAQIYEVVTFYNYFNQEPPAKYTFSVCTGTACYLKGAPKIIDALRKKLNIKEGNSYSEDRNYKIEEVRCLGCCGLAPVITINGEIHGKVKAEDIDGLVDNLTNNTKGE